MARANCSWPGIYRWPGCGGPTVDLQLAWLWMARHLQLAWASCRSTVGPGQPWILTSTDGPPFFAMHKGHIFGSIKLANVLGIKLLLYL